MLLEECYQANVNIKLNTRVNSIKNISHKQFKVITDQEIYLCDNVIIATGGLSIPTMGATAFGYQIAEQFNIPVWPTRAD